MIFDVQQVDNIWVVCVIDTLENNDDDVETMPIEERLEVKALEVIITQFRL